MRGCSQHYRWRNGGEAPGRRVSVVSAAHLGALLCLALCRPSFADSIKIFGVDVYLLEHPSCSGSSREVLAKASPFEKEARLADIITELARRTREAGANTLHSIRILSAAPYHGAEAIGIAVTCAITPDPPADLIALVAESRGAEAFAIRPTDPLGPERTLGKAEMELIRRLSEAELGTLKALIASGRQTQPGPTIQSSCPFIPDLGFRFDGGTQVWWLVSFGRGCDAATLIRPDGDWRRSRRVELTSDMVLQIKTLANR